MNISLYFLVWTFISLYRYLQDRAALSSCLRTLGIFVMFACYLTDTAFHIDVADAIIPHLLPPPDKVRLSASKNQCGGSRMIFFGSGPDPTLKWVLAPEPDRAWIFFIISELVSASRELHGKLALYIYKVF